MAAKRNRNNERPARLKGYYFITDGQLSRAGNLNDVKSALEARVQVVQYRNKSLSTRLIYEEALKLRSICRDALLIINDRLDIALSIGADGVHLGCDDLPYHIARRILGKKKIIGLTVHNLSQAQEAQRLGADYIGVSPIFPTSTKHDAGKAIGLGVLRQIRRMISLPVIAVGGIDLSNAGEVIASGADGLCAISAVVTKNNVKKEIKKFQAVFDYSR